MKHAHILTTALLGSALVALPIVSATAAPVVASTTTTIHHEETTTPVVHTPVVHTASVHHHRRHHRHHAMVKTEHAVTNDDGHVTTKDSVTSSTPR